MKCVRRISSGLTVALLVLAMGFSGTALGSSPSFCHSAADPDPGSVVLLSSAAKVSAGDRLFTRLQNGLNRPIGLGRRYLQRFGDGTWSVVVPAKSSTGVAPSPILRRERVPPETAAKCRGFEVTEDFLQGRYRVVNEVYLDLRSGIKPRKWTVEFRVL
jgi:hypothetical protein